ncbi:carnitinyl-CoA dehydratase [Escherichia coli]|uniref:Carnitinyl-CoA dehydratase n=2 Tax=Escherichia coli TaxID=562 RepID=A0A376VRK5_ECOLX|nr:carnitinyl-CoA dehydratase [Escherichia coli]
MNGYAFGGGFELALAADFIVCADNASFALPEAKLGIVPDSGGVLRLPKILPPAIVNEMVMTGRRMGAEEALRWGVVNRVVSQAELMDNARELAQQLVNSAPLAIAALKEILPHHQRNAGRRSVSLYSQRRVETLSVGSAFGRCH